MTGTDPVAVRQWGYIERVSTGLYLMSLGEAAEGAAMLAVAGRWIGGDPGG